MEGEKMKGGNMEDGDDGDNRAWKNGMVGNRDEGVVAK